MEKCTWATKHKIEEDYHDTEWGVPVYDDRLLFEMLILEGAQAGLSWLTILVKRDNYKKAFDNFEVEKIALYKQNKIDALLNNAGIVRNKLKINATITNAKAVIAIQKEFGSFSNFIWRFVNNKPIINKWTNSNQVPAKTALSDLLSKTLKKKGFKFIGSTTCYAFIQAIGMVNDHTTKCFRHNQINALK